MIDDANLKEDDIEASTKELSATVLSEIKVKRDRGNASIPLVCASRESQDFAFLSPKEPFAETYRVTCGWLGRKHLTSIHASFPTMWDGGK